MIKKIFFDLVKVILIISLGMSIKGLYILAKDQTLLADPSNLTSYLNFLTLNFKPPVNFFAAITAILSTFISIAIPLSINQVSTCLKEYQDEDVQEMFYREPVFLQMLSIIFFLLISLFCWFFSENSFRIGLVLLSFSILALYYFFQFIKRVIKYITATDDVVYAFYYAQEIKLFDFVRNE